MKNPKLKAKRPNKPTTSKNKPPAARKPPQKNQIVIAHLPAINQMPPLLSPANHHSLPNPPKNPDNNLNDRYVAGYATLAFSKQDETGEWYVAEKTIFWHNKIYRLKCCSNHCRDTPIHYIRQNPRLSLRWWYGGYNYNLGRRDPKQHSPRRSQMCPIWAKLRGVVKP